MKCWLWVEWSGLVRSGRVQDSEDGAELTDRAGRVIPPREVAAVLEPPHPAAYERDLLRGLHRAGYQVERP